ncbi:MAG: hypothetical protein ACW98K_13980 [Candidatus Kariarchaeaceae archaeon]|jgi:hypothetical protein
MNVKRRKHLIVGPDSQLLAIASVIALVMRYGYTNGSSDLKDNKRKEESQ